MVAAKPTACPSTRRRQRIRGMCKSSLDELEGANGIARIQCRRRLCRCTIPASAQAWLAGSGGSWYIQGAVPQATTKPRNHHHPMEKRACTRRTLPAAALDPEAAPFEAGLVLVGHGIIEPNYGF